MKNRFFVLLSVILYSLQANAQFTIKAQSEPFDEPRAGWTQLLLLPNGMTAFFVLHDGAMTLQLYDAAHRLKVNNENVFSSAENKKGLVFLSAFENGGSLIAICSSYDGGKINLLRWVINEKTGHAGPEEKMYSMPEPKRNIFTGTDNDLYPSFYVRKDPASDHYAVIVMINSADDPAKRMEIYYYNAKNEVIAQGFSSKGQENYEKLQMIDFSVLGDQKVSALVYAYNNKKHGDRQGDLVLMNLDSGAHASDNHELGLNKEFYVKSGLARFNPLTRRIVLLANCGKPKTDGYIPVICMVNPFDNNIENAFPVFPERADNESQALYGKKNHFTGLPQDFSFDHDGNIWIVFQEVVITQTSRQVYSDMKDIGVMGLTPNGKEFAGYFHPLDHVILETSVPDFYHAVKMQGAQSLYLGNQFKSFTYIHGPSKSYLVMNDVAYDEKKEDKGKVKRILSVGDCDGFYYSLQGDDPLLKGQFVFEKEEHSRDHNLGLFSVSDYDAEKNLYVTLKLEKEGRSKQVRLIWMEPK
jgi:hypothetical protein